MNTAFEKLSAVKTKLGRQADVVNVIETKFSEQFTDIKKDHRKAVANADDALSQLNAKLLARLASVENSALKRIAELEKELLQKTEQVEMTLQWAILLQINTEAPKFLTANQLQVAPLTLKMVDYFKKKKNGEDWFSDAFFTHSMGYKVCLNVYASGVSKTDVSIWLHLMKGPNDDHLKWPFKGRCRIKLLNQIGDGQHYVRSGMISGVDKRPTTDKKQFVWYSYDFIPHTELVRSTVSCQYLKNDTIFLQVHCRID